MENQEILEFSNYLHERHLELLEYLNPYYKKSANSYGRLLMVEDGAMVVEKPVRATDDEQMFLVESNVITHLNRILSEFELSSIDELVGGLQEDLEFCLEKKLECESLGSRYEAAEFQQSGAEFQRLLDYTRKYQSVKNPKVKCHN